MTVIPATKSYTVSPKRPSPRLTAGSDEPFDLECKLRENDKILHRKYAALDIGDSDPQLIKKRAESRYKMITTFQSIYEQYEREFDIADKTELDTGKIVIDEGHIAGLAVDPEGPWNETKNQGDEEDEDEKDDVVDEDMIEEENRGSYEKEEQAGKEEAEL